MGKGVTQRAPVARLRICGEPLRISDWCKAARAGRGGCTRPDRKLSSEPLGSGE